MAGKIHAYKRQHKAARIKQLLKDRADEARLGRDLDRALGRDVRKAESVFKGCEVR